MPRLMIGLPVYNGADSLPRALESLLAQDAPDFGIVISDNGSTDGTPQICRSFASRDPRITVHRAERNQGPAWNFNRALDLASRANYFMWGSDDDRWARDYASSCLAFLDAHPDVALCGTRAAFLRTDGRETGEIDEGCTTLGMRPVDRGVRYLRSVDRNSIYYGVYRTSHLGARRLQNRVANDQILVLDLALAHPIHTLASVKLWREVGGTSASVASIARAYGIRLRYPPPFHRLSIFEGLFDAINRSPHLQDLERARLKREALVASGRRYLRRLRSPAFVVAKLGQDLLGR